MSHWRGTFAFMPTIYDNQSASMLRELRNTLDDSFKADFCVGYFNLRGWQTLAPQVEGFAGGENAQARVLIGMNASPDDELRVALRIGGAPDDMDNARVVRLRKTLLEGFRRQLTFGLPTNGDKTALLQLRDQLLARKVVVKLHAAFALHAKLYLCHQAKGKTPLVGYIGSSNLTLSGLLKQGELNIDVLEQDAAQKLEAWFGARWDDRWSLDISADLAKALAESWITPRTPFHLYLKIAYNLSREARAGQAEFELPRTFRGKLFDYQLAAVKIAARHLHKRGGVVIGDVVGLGKTITAAAIASIFLDAPPYPRLLVLCPPKLVSMWEAELERLGVRGRVHPISRARDLAELRRYQLVIIDESHNLRSGEGKTYALVHDYIHQNAANVILLSATPYNKHYSDLYHQLRLFLRTDEPIGIRPENYILQLGATEFEAKHQYKSDTLGAFQFSAFPDDWRELMRHYLVRRTRSFIKEHYALPRRTDADYDEAARKYLLFPDGTRQYFAARLPRTVRFAVDGDDPYSHLYSESVVSRINKLRLPRYGLAGYLDASCELKPNTPEAKVIENLGRAGKRLMGFCRTNLFKRLESCGPAFLLSLKRHLLRNELFLYALQNKLPLPIGTQDAAALDTAFVDGDENGTLTTDAPKLYDLFSTTQKSRFDWVRPEFFGADLTKHLKRDNFRLRLILKMAGNWNPQGDKKLAALETLICQTHKDQKILLFSQFADTIAYLGDELAKRGVTHMAAVTGQSDDPLEPARRFSPVSNGLDPAKIEPVRVLLATDVLSEGQNLQDAHIIVNFDLPWAIIRLIQRAGRVDRIGQTSETIVCYSFLPADGVEKLIRLRSRLKDRLSANGEVLGTDERFFEDETHGELSDLFSEKAGILDDEGDGEVDLASYAFQIWDSARRADPALDKIVPNLPNSVAGAMDASPKAPHGAIVYTRTADDTDVLVQLDANGAVQSQSQWTILRAAACDALTPMRDLAPEHETLVARGVEAAIENERALAGSLGKKTGARYRVFNRLKAFHDDVKNTLFEPTLLAKTVDALYGAPLQSAATEMLNTQLKIGIPDERLAELCICLHEESKLIQHTSEDAEGAEPQIICSLGLV